VKIFVFRHGEAELSFGDDTLRQLTSHGRQQVEDSLRKKSEILKSTDTVLTSPLVRAQQSGEILQCFLPAAEVRAVDWLTPSSSPKDAIQQLSDLQEKRKISVIALVTHLPFVADFIETLCGLQRGSIRMTTGSLVAIETDVIAKGCAELCWQYHPQ